MQPHWPKRCAALPFSVIWFLTFLPENCSASYSSPLCLNVIRFSVFELTLHLGQTDKQTDRQTYGAVTRNAASHGTAVRTMKLYGNGTLYWNISVAGEHFHDIMTTKCLNKLDDRPRVTTLSWLADHVDVGGRRSRDEVLTVGGIAGRHCVVHTAVPLGQELHVENWKRSSECRGRNGNW